MATPQPLTHHHSSAVQQTAALTKGKKRTAEDAVGGSTAVKVARHSGSNSPHTAGCAAQHSGVLMGAAVAGGSEASFAEGAHGRGAAGPSGMAEDDWGMANVLVEMAGQSKYHMRKRSGVRLTQQAWFHDEVEDMTEDY